MDATILIPTYNRPLYLRRLLCFLDELRNDYPIMILDASCEHVQHLNSKMVVNYSRMQIEHRTYSEAYHLGMRVADGLQRTETPFFVLCGDDDLMVPSAINKCVDTLRDDDEVSAAIGRTLCLLYRSRKKRGRKTGFGFLDALSHNYELTQKSFISRYLGLQTLSEVGAPPLYYAVRRTCQGRNTWRLTNEQMKYSSLELLGLIFTLLHGKVKAIDDLYILRDYTNEPTRESMRDDPVLYYTHEDLESIRPHFVKQLMEVERVSAEVANYMTDIVMRLPQEKSLANFNAPATKSWVRRLLIRSKRKLDFTMSSIFPGHVAKRMEFDVEIMRAISSAQRTLFGGDFEAASLKDHSRASTDLSQSRNDHESKAA